MLLVPGFCGAGSKAVARLEGKKQCCSFLTRATYLIIAAYIAWSTHIYTVERRRFELPASSVRGNFLALQGASRPHTCVRFRPLLHMSVHGSPRHASTSNCPEPGDTLRCFPLRGDKSRDKRATSPARPFP